MKPSPPPVQRFFNSLSRDYTHTIERCFPRYREMLWAIMNYLPGQRTFHCVLDLGCGTGNLSQLIHERFPQASLRVVDISEDSLDVCRTRLQAFDGLTCDHSDFRDLDYPAGSFDLVVSNIAIHHLDSGGKRQLFKKIHNWLTPQGILCFADQCAGATDDLYARHIDNWKSISMGAGADDDEWAMWMQHQRDCDYHDTMFEQMQWLREAGFVTVDSLWRYLLWTVIQARK